MLLRAIAGEIVLKRLDRRRGAVWALAPLKRLSHSPGEPLFYARSGA